LIDLIEDNRNSYTAFESEEMNLIATRLENKVKPGKQSYNLAKRPIQKPVYHNRNSIFKVSK